MLPGDRGPKVGLSSSAGRGSRRTVADPGSPVIAWTAPSTALTTSAGVAACTSSWAATRTARSRSARLRYARAVNDNRTSMSTPTAAETTATASSVITGRALARTNSIPVRSL